MLTAGLSVAQRQQLLARYRFHRPPHYSTFYDFDAWVYGIDWPSVAAGHAAAADFPLSQRVSVVADDIKFAFNAWSLLRLSVFFGLDHPTVLSRLSNTTPTMAIHDRGNRMFHQHCHTGGALNPHATKVALMPSHPQAVALGAAPWERWRAAAADGTVQVVLGMENGMRPEVTASCDAFVSIPQYGSVGSLSMMSALGIVLHAAHRHLHPIATAGNLDRRAGDGPSAAGEVALLPQKEAGVDHVAIPPRPTKGSAEYFPEQRPHGDELLGLDDAAIGAVLAERRRRLPLQLAMLWHNECGDRNIGAAIRNGNVYNMERMVILNRRKFSRRGTVGTHHYMDLVIAPRIEDAEAALEGYVLWMLHPTFPYLADRTDEIHPAYVLPKQLPKALALQSNHTFMRDEDPRLQAWLAAQTTADWAASHPMYAPAALAAPPLWLDDDSAVHAAVVDVQRRGLRGIMLVVPEEGSTPLWHLLQRCERVISVVHPSRLCQRQRGLTPAVSTAIALERLREATLRLPPPSNRL